MRLQGKHGYWLCDHYPIGGCFRRAPIDGLEIAEICHMDYVCQGCNAYGKTKEGSLIAFHTSHLCEKLVKV